MIIEDITVQQYIDLEDKHLYDFAIKYAFIFTDSINEFQIGDIFDFEFGLIKDTQYEILDEMSVMTKFDIVGKFTNKDISKLSLMKVIRQFNYISEQIELIVDVERQMLSHEPSDYEIQAGIDDFADLGVYLQIQQLTNSDVTKIEDVRKVKYNDCFLELLTRKRSYDFNKRKDEIIQLKNKHYH